MKKTYNSPVIKVREVKYQNLMDFTSTQDKQGYTDDNNKGGYSKETRGIFDYEPEN